MVSWLDHLLSVTCPNISFSVGVLTHHLKSSIYAPCKAACRVLNYFTHYPRISLCYSGRNLNHHVNTDSTWVSDKATAGVIVMMASSSVNGLFVLQPTVAVFSMEAKYIAHSWNNEPIQLLFTWTTNQHVNWLKLLSTIKGPSNK